MYLMNRITKVQMSDIMDDEQNLPTGRQDTEACLHNTSSQMLRSTCKIPASKLAANYFFAIASKYK